MTVRELFAIGGEHPWVLAGALVGPPIVAALLPLLHGRDAGGQSPWKYLYSTLIYLVSVPGILAAVAAVYMMFFTHENLMDVNVLAYALPIAAMGATLGLIRRTVKFDLLPGFDRLMGLMVTIAVVLALALALEKTRIWLFFGGSIFLLIGFVIVALGLVRWGTSTLFGRRGDARIEPPV